MRFNIIVDDDKCWGLNIVKNTVKFFISRNLKIDKIWVLPNKISNKNKSNVSTWYLKTFGIFVFLKLGIFYTLVILKNIFSGFSNFNCFSKNYGVDVVYLKSLNEKILINYLKKNKKVTTFAITNHLFDNKIINLKNHNIINKHASLLPSFRGLFPYFWTQVYGRPNGVTYHLIDERIDNGKIIFQKKINKKFYSMIDFYIYIFNYYPKYLFISLKNLKNRRFKKRKYSKSYYSLPTNKDYKEFLKNKGCIISLCDLLKTNKISNFKN